jgi:hypothetical protein
MVFLPSGASPHITAGTSLDELSSWLHGGAPIPAKGPHTASKGNFGCVVTKDFDVAATRSHFKAGMQGQILEEETRHGVKYAKIHIEGVTETWVPEPKTGEIVWVKNQWVPMDNIQKGRPWKTDMKDWPMTIEHVPHSFDATEWLRDTPADVSILGRTIAALLTAFHSEPTSCIDIEVQGLIEKKGVESITKALIRGVRDAGVYNVLNRPNFTVSDLVNASTEVIEDGYDTNKGGIYIRNHLSNGSVTHWSKFTKYLYVGKTVNYGMRYRGHKYTQSSYGHLTKNSSQLDMVAICILRPNDIGDLAYIAEQVFLCLFQSYRSALFHINEETSGKYVGDIQSAQYFTELAKQVFGHTRWPGGIHRESFGVTRGANWSSPLEECSRISTNLWIRTDTRIKDRFTGKSTPVATFRSAKAMKMPVGGDKLAHTSTNNPYCFHVWDKKASKRRRIMHLAFRGDGVDGSKAPLPGVFFYLVFEVYTDGSPHPHAYSRLPSIGPFMNWDQARSFGVRMEWEYPMDSGKWMCRYLQAGRPMRFAEPKIPGALFNYANAISFLQWLFATAPNHSYGWIPNAPGAANVRQIFYNLHEQTITIRPPGEQLVMVSAALKSADTMIKQLKDPKLGLDNVGGEFGQFSGNQNSGRPRRYCDMCTMLPPVAYDNGVFKKGCIRIGDLNLCQVCQSLGRPCCTWTDKRGIKPATFFTPAKIARGDGKSVATLAEDVALWKAVFAATITQHPWVPTDSVQSYERKLVFLGESGETQEDPSDVPIPQKAGEEFEDDDDLDDLEDLDDLDE